MDRQITPVFYKSLSPPVSSGAAAAPPCLRNSFHYQILEQGKARDDLLALQGDINLVQESTYCMIMVRSTFYPSLTSSKMMSQKFHTSSSSANHHKCPFNFPLPNGESNFQSNFLTILIADSDSLQRTMWRKCLSFLQILVGTPSKLQKTTKNLYLPELTLHFLSF